jgi:exodeoxyribonuclease-5
VNKDIELSKDQKVVFDFIIDKIKSGSYLTTFGGLSGTGKSTLITKITTELRKEKPFMTFAFMSFTGKASTVLKTKLKFESMINSIAYKKNLDYVGTCHQFMYKSEMKYDSELKRYVITGWKKKKKEEIHICDLIIIDEASMLPNYMLDDLKSYNIPILAVGDHGQLPPVSKKKEYQNVIQNPDIKLTKIHRQSEKSAIIKLSQFVRDYGFIPNNTVFDKQVFKIDWNHKKCQKIWNDKLTFDKNMICACGFNYSRVVINEMIRNKFGFTENFPYADERIICLKNDHKRGIMNGELGTLVFSIGLSKKFMKVTLDMDYNEENLYIDCASYLNCFNQEYYQDIYDNNLLTQKEERILKDNKLSHLNFFDYGYCASVHKLQGSEFDTVVLFEQKGNNWTDEYFTKWLYTGITRAKNKLMIISNFK